jgi:hypothetical protein
MFILVWAVVVLSLVGAGLVVGYTIGERAGMARRRGGDKL